MKVLNKARLDALERALKNKDGVLVVEQVELARPTRHEQVDHPLGPRRVVRPGQHPALAGR